MQHRHGTYSSEDTADMLRTHIHGISTDVESRHQRIRWDGHGEPPLSNLLLPQFVIIGAQKAGTSDMWARMKRRADILGPGPSGFQPKPSKAGYYLDRDKVGMCHSMVRRIVGCACQCVLVHRTRAAACQVCCDHDITYLMCNCLPAYLSAHLHACPPLYIYVCTGKVCSILWTQVFNYQCTITNKRQQTACDWFNAFWPRGSAAPPTPCFQFSVYAYNHDRTLTMTLVTIHILLWAAQGGADKELHWFDHCLGVNGGKSKTASMLTRTPPNATRWCDADDYIRCWPPPPPLPPPSRTHAASDAHAAAPASTARLSASAAPLTAAGEASPSYLLFPELATIMHQIVPDAKLVVLLRDPVARAFSSYYNGRSAWQHPKHLGLRDNDRFVPFEQAVLPELSIIERCAGEVPDIAKRFEACIWPEFVVHTLELTLTPHGPWNTSVEYAAGRCSAYYIRKRSLLIRGLYAGQLAAYLEHYPAPEQMLVVSSADYFADPEGVSAQAAAHVLGVGRGAEAGGADVQGESLVARPPIASKHRPNAKAATADRNPTTPLHVAMDSVTETRLRAMFAPYNALLYRMLADRGIRFTPF